MSVKAKPAPHARSRVSESVHAAERDNQTNISLRTISQPGTIEIYAGLSSSGRTYPARGYWYARDADDRMLGRFGSQADATTVVYRAASQAAVDTLLADRQRPRDRS